MAIIGVHGIWNYGYFRKSRDAVLAAAAISGDWSGWLSSGGRTAGYPGDVAVQVAYYAHHLHRGTPQSPDDVMLLDDEAQEVFLGLVDLLRPVPVRAQGPRTARIRSAADWLTRKHGVTARRLVTVFAREVSSYLKESGGQRRLAAREAVASVIRAAQGDSPVTVVAHSLGSVVTYEALWAHPELSVHRLVTLGSPLGMPGVVFDRLDPCPDALGGRPPGVGEWINLADAGDLVAVPRAGLGGGFTGISREEPALTIAEWDCHTVRSYLTCPDVAEAIFARFS